MYNIIVIAYNWICKWQKWITLINLNNEIIQVALNPHQIHNFDQLLDEISEKIGLIKGVRRLYSLEGLPITTFEQLENKHVI